MRFIPDLITSRIQAKMKEMSIGEIIDLCQCPIEYNERGITLAIQAIIKESNLPIEEWTAQERYAAVLHYFVNVFYSGEIPMLDDESETSLADYLLSQDYPLKEKRSLSEQTLDMGLRYDFVLDGESDKPDYLSVLPLTGKWIEAVERVVLGGYVRGIKDKAEAWKIALAAAQIVPREASLADLENNHTSIDKAIVDNINIILSMPESHYLKLMAAFEEALQALDHIVVLRVVDDGLALLKGGSGLMPYRFQFNALISHAAFRAWARDERADDNHAVAA